jgi:tetratricopeptide (TPR) repeat protein
MAARALLSATLILCAVAAGGSPVAWAATDPVFSSDISNAAIAEQAETAFAEGVRLKDAADRARPHFRRAALCFEELNRRGAHNATLYLNLGNAWLLAGELPHAILAYRRGVRLAPEDPALQTGLAAAREQVAYPSGSTLGRPAVDHRPPWLPRLSSDWMFAASVVLYFVAWVCLTRWLMNRARRLLVAGLLALLAAGLLTFFILAATHDEGDKTVRPLVVIADDGVLLRKGDNLNFPQRYDTPLNKGVEARLLFERGEWLQIELAGGEVGWVPRGLALVDR